MLRKGGHKDREGEGGRERGEREREKKIEESKERQTE